MTLPDWCYGRRWWVGLQQSSPSGGDRGNLFVAELPDKFVVWGVLIACRSLNCISGISATIRLAKERIAFITNPMRYERVLKGMGRENLRNEFYVDGNDVTWIKCEREIIESAGRKMAVITSGDLIHAYDVTIGVQISALPKEVPDWLISVPGQSPF